MKKDTDIIRHRMIYRAAHLLVPIVLRKYSFQTDHLNKTDENYLVLSNHLTESDMLMLGAALSAPMYFVAGEHLLRSRYARLIRWAQDPIFEYKGDVAVQTVKEIIRRVRAGHNVMIFPEGSRSFNGETETLPVSIGKLVKLTGGGLVTYHIEGGYFVAPRWAYTSRRGPVSGQIRSVLSKAEVAAMSREEVTDLINRDLYEHAYDTQRKKHARYKGKRLAEGLENYLVKCPVCDSFDSLRTRDDRFVCSCCGLKGRYTVEGFLEGDSLPFDSVYDWGKWAEAETERHIRETEAGEVCFRDTDIQVYEITADHQRVELGSGAVRGYADRIVAGGMIFDFQDIPAMNMLYFGKTLLFTISGRHVGITGDHFHAIKYQKLYDLFQSGETTVPGN